MPLPRGGLVSKLSFIKLTHSLNCFCVTENSPHIYIFIRTTQFHMWRVQRNYFASLAQIVQLQSLIEPKERVFGGSDFGSFGLRRSVTVGDNWRCFRSLVFEGLILEVGN